MRTALLLATAMLLTSCFGVSSMQMVSAGTTGCDPDAIEISDKRDSRGVISWTARCGGQTYRCNYVGYGDANCALAARTEASAPPRESGPSAAAVQRQQEAMLERDGPRFEFARTDGVLRGVRATFDTRDAVIRLFFAPEVDRDNVQIIIAPRGNASLPRCENLTVSGRSRALSAPLVDARANLPRVDLIALTQEDPPPTARFCGGSWLLQRADILGFARFAEHIEEALTSAPAPAGSANAAPVAVGDGQSAVRARLNSRSAALRACAGTSVVAVEASWDAHGELTLRVRGEQDAAVHACVQAAVGRERVPTTTAGRLIHVIEAD